MSNVQLAATSTIPCPRCQQPLIDPEGLGWCRACGFCRSLVETEKKIDPAEKREAPSGRIAATSEAVGHLPVWFWVMFVGVLLIALAIYGAAFAGLTIPQRALTSTILIAAGVTAMFAGQFIALLRIAPEDSTLTFKDAVVPLRLYGLVFKRLPETRLTVFTGAWGATAIVTSVIFIGGLGHWLTYLPGNQQSAQVQKGAKAKASAIGEKSSRK